MLIKRLGDNFTQTFTHGVRAFFVYALILAFEVYCDQCCVRCVRFEVGGRVGGNENCKLICLHRKSNKC